MFCSNLVTWGACLYVTDLRRKWEIRSSYMCWHLAIKRNDLPPVKQEDVNTCWCVLWPLLSFSRSLPGAEITCHKWSGEKQTMGGPSDILHFIYISSIIQNCQSANMLFVTLDTPTHTHPMSMPTLLFSLDSLCVWLWPDICVHGTIQYNFSFSSWQS